MILLSSSPLPVPSIVFAVIALLVISVAVLLILRHYLPLRTTPAYLLVPVFFALWLPASIVLLVPIDLASSAGTEDEAAKGIWLPNRALLVSWRITYWLTFVLTWFILPILAEYSDAGYREPKDRILYSLRQNAQYHAIVLCTGVVGLVYFFVSYGLSFKAFKGLVMALSYCWGLILAIYLMGHGLVTIPRSLFRNARASERLRRLQSRAPKLYEKMEDALLNLEEVEVQISELSRRKTGTARDFQDWIEELSDMCNLPESRPIAAATRPGNDSRTIPTVVTEKYLADLTRRLIRARHARSRYVDEWNRLLHNASKAQAVLDAKASKRLDFGASSPSSSFWESITILTPYTRYLLYCHFLPGFRIFLGGFLALASICIIWSELVKAALPSLSVIRYTVVHHWSGDVGRIGFAGQVIAAFWILYMCTAALQSVTEVKVWRGRALVHRNTAHESAFWYAGQVARLSVPLSYNFVTFLSPTIYVRTTFYSFLGQYVKLTRLGEWFDYLFPILVLVPVCATLFGLYGRVKRLLGFADLVDDEDDDDQPSYGTGSWREGRDLIERELHGTSLSRRMLDDDAALSSRAGAGGLDNPRGARAARAAPILSVPAARREGISTPFATSPSYRDRPIGNVAGRPSRSARPGPPEEEDEDDNFFTNLGHRFKNTIDTIDTPKWLQEIGDGFKKPKWMGGGDDAGESSSGRPGQGPGRTDSDIRRWFGGEGRIRL